MKVRIVDVGRVWDCMLCTCVSEEGGDGEGERSEAPSLLSYTLRYVSLAELVDVCPFGSGRPVQRFEFATPFFFSRDIDCEKRRRVPSSFSSSSLASLGSG
jgi:hypothetical protein